MTPSEPTEAAEHWTFDDPAPPDSGFEVTLSGGYMISQGRSGGWRLEGGPPWSRWHSDLTAHLGQTPKSGPPDRTDSPATAQDIYEREQPAEGIVAPAGIYEERPPRKGLVHVVKRDKNHPDFIRKWLAFGLLAVIALMALAGTVTWAFQPHADVQALVALMAPVTTLAAAVFTYYFKETNRGD